MKKQKEAKGKECAFYKGQYAPPILLTFVVTSFLLFLISIYSYSNSIEYKYTPTHAVRRIVQEKQDIDSDFCILFRSFGVEVNGTSFGDGSNISFSINFTNTLFGNASNYTRAYKTYVNSSTKTLLLDDFLSALDNKKLLISEFFTNTVLQLDLQGKKQLRLSTENPKSIYMRLYTSNTSEISWNPPLENEGDINISLLLNNYDLHASAVCGENCSINKTANYTANFSTAYGNFSISFIEGMLELNFTEDLLVNITATVQGKVEEKPLFYLFINTTNISTAATKLSTVCSGSEPRFTNTTQYIMTERKYGSAEVSGRNIYIIVANLSQNISGELVGDFNTIYIDNDGDCNFVGASDEYFAKKGEWVRIGNLVATPVEITGESTTFIFSSGAELVLPPARLVQPIFICR
ncbi:MAG: hypothetical protein QXP42_00905 [Candidatus Micrarchaeia archaeon]